MNDPGTDGQLTLANVGHDYIGGDDNEDAGSAAHTLSFASSGHDSRLRFDDESISSSSITTASSELPGAIRVDDSGTEVRLHKGHVNGETEEEDVSSIVPNNNGSSDVVVQPSPVEGIAVPEPRLGDSALALTVAAPIIQESPSDASVATVWELVNRREQLVIDAVRVHGPDENTGGGGRLENIEEMNHTIMCGLSSLWIKWLVLLGTMIMIIIPWALMFLLGPKPLSPDSISNQTIPTSPPSTPDPTPTPIAVPTSTPSTPGGTSTPITVPMSVIFNALVEYIPDLLDLPHRNSSEYRAMEWLSQDNGTIFIKDDNGTLFTKDMERFVQRYAMAVFYYETGFSTNSTSDWLSSQSTCTWAGLACDVNGGTSITSLSLGKHLRQGIRCPPLYLPPPMISRLYPLDF
jgi:hypothetical protein